MFDAEGASALVNLDKGRILASGLEGGQHAYVIVRRSRVRVN